MSGLRWRRASWLLWASLCAALACSNGGASGGGGNGGVSRGGGATAAGGGGGKFEQRGAAGSNAQGGALDGHAGEGGSESSQGGVGGKAGSSGNSGAGASAHVGGDASGGDAQAQGGSEGGAAQGGSAAGDGNSGGAAGSAGQDATPRCGNGVVEAGEACEPPSSALCSEQCGVVATQGCVDCEQAGACQALSNVCQDNFTSEDDRSICYAVQACVRSSACASGSNPVQHCFCGALSTAECSAAPVLGNGAPKGVCAGVIREGLALDGQPPTNAQVLSRLIDESFPAGAALARVNCDRADPTCIKTCGY